MPSLPNPYREHLDPNPANYAVLTPVDFLDWAAQAYPSRLAVIHGDLHQPWAAVQQICRQMAARLQDLDIGVGDTVAVIDLASGRALKPLGPVARAHAVVPLSNGEVAVTSGDA
ncbi:MAG: hypothetical protein EBX59_00855, partial [Betaproteobacteria bacterium]|nr:hypothetical protein [Betaproteobacteria bacterium]